jgi:hypothetical protein
VDVGNVLTIDSTLHSVGVIVFVTVGGGGALVAVAGSGVKML